MVVKTIVALLVVICTSNVAVANFQQISPKGCNCPGDQVVFQCTTSGPGSTRYNVSGCSFSSLNLLHTSFVDANTSVHVNGLCDWGAGADVVAQSVSTNDTHYTSSLTLRALPKISDYTTFTVECYYDDGENNTLIGMGITLKTENPAPPTHINKVSDNPVILSWSRATVPPACSARYQVNATFCATCPSIVSDTTTNCGNAGAVQEDCRVSIRTIVCESIVGESSETFIFSSSSDPLITSSATTSSSDTTPSLSGLSAVHIGIICATLVVLVVVVIGSIIIILWYRHVSKCTSSVKRKPQSNKDCTESVDLPEIKQTLATIMCVVNSVQQELKIRNTEIEETRQELHKKNQSLSDTQKALDENIKQLDETTKRNSELTRENSELTRENTNLTTRNCELSEEVIRLTKENTGLRKEVNDLKQKRNALQAKLDEMTANKGKLQEDIQKLQEDIQNLNNAKASQKDVEKMQEELQKIRGSLPSSTTLTALTTMIGKDIGKEDELMAHISRTNFDKGDVRSYKNGHDVQDPSQLHSDKGKLDQTHCSISEENNESIINL